MIYVVKKKICDLLRIMRLNGTKVF